MVSINMYKFQQMITDRMYKALTAITGITAGTSTGKQYIKFFSITIPNTITGATVSPSIFNLLESVHSLFLSSHATTRNLKEANCWFWIHCEVQEE